MRCNVARSKTRYTAEGHGLESRLLARPSRKNPKIPRAKYMFLVTDRDPSNANLPYSTASIAFDACTEVGSTYQDSQTARTSQYYAKENDKMYRPFSHCLGETVSMCHIRMQINSRCSPLFFRRWHRTGSLMLCMGGPEMILNLPAR